VRLRNGAYGYGAVTKALHWLTLGLLVTQLTVGYSMEADADVADVECDPPGEDRSGGDTSDAEDERMDRLEDRCEAARDRREEEADDAVGTAWSDLWSGEAFGDGIALPEWHVLIGLAIIGIGLARVVWRSTTPLPPWDERLTATDRAVLHVVERALLALLFLVPASGIALVAGSDGLLPLHIAAHLCFYAALSVHVFVVVRRRVVGRMLPSVA
jgi:cytochrome b561